MRRLAVVGSLIALGACSSGSPVIPANFRGAVAIVPFVGRNPATPDAGFVPLLAVASFRGDELRLVDPSTDQPVAAPNMAWPLAIPTIARPSALAAISLGDGLADLLVVAGAEPRFQIIGTWLDGTSGYGVVETVSLADLVGSGAQIFSLAAAAIPSGPPTGTPPVAPATPGRARVLVGCTTAGDTVGGQLVVVEVARQPDGSIAVSSVPVVKALGFAPTALTAAPDNVHVYVASVDPILDSSGASTFGVAEIDASGDLSATWPVRALGSRNAPTMSVSAAFVGERTQSNFYTFAPPALRVYAALAPSGCGPERDIACGVATFDPALGGLAADPAPPGLTGSAVPKQTYRTPLYVPSLPLATGVALPASVPASEPPGVAFGSQVCYSPAVAGVPLPLCPAVTEVPTLPAFNGGGAPQSFMLQAPPTGQLWTSAVGITTGVDGFAYIQDLGRFGPVNAASMLNDDTTRTAAFNAVPVVPTGPVGNSAFFGFPPGTAGIGFWADAANPPVVVVSSTALADATTVWPGFTQNDHWLVSYQGVLPGIAGRRSVLGLSADGTLYVGIQESAVPAPDGVLPASSYWVPRVIVGRPDVGIHTVEKDGAPGDIAQFLLDVDPCPSKRPNWIPANQTTPVYDPTKPPQAQEAVVLSLIDPDPALYPGGALRLGPAADAVLAAEYQCLVDWFQLPANAGKVLTAFQDVGASIEWVRGTWVRAGGLVLAGRFAGYAGRPVLDVPFELAWTDETGLSGEALVLARKARRFFYPSAFPARSYAGYPGMTDPMQPGPALGFRVGRYCSPTVTDCDPLTSPPARDAGVDFFTRSGLVVMSRHPSSTAGGNYVSSFDKSIIPGQEYRGRVFYVSFTGDLIMMIPPGLDVGQTVSIR